VSVGASAPPHRRLSIVLAQCGASREIYRCLSFFLAAVGRFAPVPGTPAVILFPF